MKVLRWRRAAVGLTVIAVLATAVLGTGGLAQELRFLRIGTGATGGTYFPVGGLIANAISNPPGSRPCEAGGSCGVPGLIAVTQSTQGSVANILSIADGSLDMGLSQADIAYFAYFGRGNFAGKPPITGIQAVANLFPEKIHVVVRADSGIRSVRDLRGKRVSLGEKESGTLVSARIVLAAYGLEPANLEAHYEKVGTSGDMLVEGSLDAFFMVGGEPINAIADTAAVIDIALLPIDGAEAEAIRKEHPFLAATDVPANTYAGVETTPTLAVGAQWIVAESMSADLVYAVTAALWHPNSRRVLDAGHPNGRKIQLERALDGVAIPLHPGAARFYDEAGLTRAGVF